MRIEEILSLVDLGYFVVVRCERNVQEPFYIGQVILWQTFCVVWANMMFNIISNNLSVIEFEL